MRAYLAIAAAWAFSITPALAEPWEPNIERPVCSMLATAKAGGIISVSYHGAELYSVAVSFDGTRWDKNRVYNLTLQIGAHSWNITARPYKVTNASRAFIFLDAVDPQMIADFEAKGDKPLKVYLWDGANIIDVWTLDYTTKTLAAVRECRNQTR